MENNQNPIKPQNKGNITAGLILILIGIAFLLRNLNFFLPEWLFRWPTLLILVGIFSGIKHRFRNNAWIFLIGFGIFFLLQDYFIDIPNRKLMLPIFIIVAGAIMILRPNRSLYGNKFYGKFANKDWSKTDHEQATNKAKDADNNDYLNVDSVFSGVQRTVLSKNFQGGKVTCVFGGAEIDLTQADFTGTTFLKLEAVFGGIKLIIPPHWQVINEIEGLFHGVDDKRKSPAGAYNDINKKLVLKGSAVFGGIEIRSY